MIMVHMQERKSIKSWEYSERLSDLMRKGALLYFRAPAAAVKRPGIFFR